MTIKLAVIGCGRVAGHHIRAIQSNKNLQLIAVCDLDEIRMHEVAPDNSILKYHNYFDMLDAHPDINAVSIITPSGMHFEHAFDIIENYKKSVIIEKPIVMTPEQGQTLSQAAKKADVHIFPVHQYRFNRCVQRIKTAISQKELGETFLSTVRMRWCRPQSYYDRSQWRGTYALDGGCTTNQGIHHLDLLRYLNGEVKRVNAVMATFGSNIEVEDTVVATLEFENGSLGNFEVTTAARPDDFESSLSIMGSKGMAMLGGAFTDKLLEFSPKPTETVEYSDHFQDAYGYGHNDIYEGVHRTLSGNGEPALTFADGMKTIQLLHAIYVSAEENRWVEIKDNLSSSKLGRNDETLNNLYRSQKNDASKKSSNIAYKSKEIESFYKENRLNWEDFYNSEKHIFEKLNINKNTRVLDIGCGCGGLGNALNERFDVRDYVGVDINQQAVDTGKKLFPNFKFFSKDILNIQNDEIEKNSFDIVVSLGCIDWNVEFHKMLEAAIKFVKPGGFFVSSFRLTDKVALDQSYQHINFTGEKSGEKAPYIVLTANELINTLQGYNPQKIMAYGYWGVPSLSAVTPYEKICFSVFATQIGHSNLPCQLDLDLPSDLDFQYER